MRVSLLSIQPDPSVWTVSTTSPEDDTSPIIVSLRPHPHLSCPQCGAVISVRAEESYPVADLPYGDHPVLIRYYKSELTCSCGLSMTLEEPGIRRGNRGIGWTEALARYVARHTTERVDDLRMRTGLPNARIQALRQASRSTAALPESLQVIGIDELYLNGRRFAVVTDITGRRLLQFEPVATTMDGLSDRMTLSALLGALPTPTTVTLDMNPVVLRTVRALWPRAQIVVDKRHALRSADRSFTRLIRQLLNSRLRRGHDGAQPFFGESAYQSYRLRHLVTKRSASCTPTDLAQWELLQKEEPTLWKAYLFRERLYDIFTFQTQSKPFKKSLEVWQAEVRTWLNDPSSGPRNHSPLTEALMMLTEFTDDLVNYVESRTTNAFTEFVNSRLREHARQGRRYSPEALIALVNEELRRPAVSDRIAPATRAWQAWQVDASATLDGDETLSPVASSAPDSGLVPMGAELKASEPATAVATRRGRRVTVNRHWPEEVQRWLSLGPTRRRAQFEAHLVSAALPAERVAWLQAMRSADLPLPEALELHVLCRYLQTQPEGDLNGELTGVIAHLSNPERLPVLARPYLTLLARAAVVPLAEPGHWAAIREVFRRIEMLRAVDMASPIHFVLQEIDGLRRSLINLPSYVPFHARLNRIGEKCIPDLLLDEGFCWGLAAAAYEREWGTVQALETLSRQVIEAHESLMSKNSFMPSGEEKNVEHSSSRR